MSVILKLRFYDGHMAKQNWDHPVFVFYLPRRLRDGGWSKTKFEQDKNDELLYHEVAE